MVQLWLGNRFNQEDYIMYSKLEELIIKAATKIDYTQELQEVIKRQISMHLIWRFILNYLVKWKQKFQESNFHLMTYSSAFQILIHNITISCIAKIIILQELQYH